MIKKEDANQKKVHGSTLDFDKQSLIFLKPSNLERAMKKTVTPKTVVGESPEIFVSKKPVINQSKKTHLPNSSIITNKFSSVFASKISNSNDHLASETHEGIDNLI